MKHSSANASFSPMRRRLLAAGAAIAGVPLLGRAATSPHAGTDFGRFVEAQMRQANIPGLGVGYAVDGRIRFVRGYGHADLAARRPVTADTMFHAASLTKPVVATGIMMLSEAGKLDLDEPVDTYLDFAVANPHQRAPIRVRHLMSHVSSISDETYYKVDSRERGKDAATPLGDFLKDYLVPGGRHYRESGSFSTAVPGTTWDYSNVAYGLLGYLGGRVAGVDLREYLRAQMFDRLGMHHSVWRLADAPPASVATPYDVVDGTLQPTEPVGFPDWSAGMLRASVGDYTRFAAAAANGGVCDERRILSAAGAAAMLTARKPAGLPTWLEGQGLGWMASPLEGRLRFQHWGGDPGVFTAAYIDVRLRAAAVVFANTTATGEAKTAIKAIASRLLAHGVD